MAIIGYSWAVVGYGSGLHSLVPGLLAALRTACPHRVFITSRSVTVRPIVGGSLRGDSGSSTEPAGEEPGAVQEDSRGGRVWGGGGGRREAGDGVWGVEMG